MLNSVFDYTKHFGKQEKWGDYRKMFAPLVFALDFVREDIGLPIYVHCGFELKGHSPRSYHHIGRAVDFHFGGSIPLSITLPKLIGSLSKIDMPCGIGVYPCWNSQGFHLEARFSDYKYWVSYKAGEYLFFDSQSHLLREIKL